MPEPTVLGELSGHLMTIDISDVRPGDVVFLGGHLVRRAWAGPRPSARTRDWVGFQGLRLDEPSDGSVARGWFGKPAGTGVLVVRPRSSDVTSRVRSPGSGDHADVDAPPATETTVPPPVTSTRGPHPSTRSR